MKTLASIGEMVVEARISAGMSQGELAAKAKVGASTLERIEQGRPPAPSRLTMQRLAIALGKDYDADLMAFVQPGGDDDVRLIRAILERLAKITDEPVKMLLEFVARKERAVKPRRIKNNPPARRGNIKRLADLDENEIVR